MKNKIHPKYTDGARVMQKWRSALKNDSLKKRANL